MCLFVLFCVSFSLLFNGCVSEKHVLFIYDMADTIVYHEADLIRNVEQVAAKFPKESDLKFKIINPYKPSIIEIEKSESSSLPSISNPHDDFQIKKHSTLQNLLTWLQKSPSYSVIYVITDNLHPSDQHVVYEILEKVQIKRTEVNFIVNSQDLKNHVIEEYRLISFVSNGYALVNFHPFNWFSEYSKRIEYDNSNEEFAILVLFGLIYASQKVTITSIEGQGERNHCFWIDPFLTDVSIMIQANNETSFLFMNMKYVTSKSNEECIHIDPKWHQPIYSIRVIARSEFNFIYGFSTDSVDSLDDTYMRPIKGKSNRIYISLNNKNTNLQPSLFEIILRNGTRLRGSKLQQVRHNANLFLGRFEPPKEEYFYIEVYSTVNERPVIRMSLNAISAANGFGEDYNNPKLGPDRIPLEMYLLILIFICLIVILVEIVWIIRTYKKSPEIPPTPLELEKLHRRAKSNFYHPVSYNSRGQNVEIV